MNDLLYQFWYYQPGGNAFVQFGKLHLSILLGLGLILLAMYHFREEIRSIPNRPLEIGLALVMIAPRIMMYFWLLNYETTLQEILPIYICRIVIICTAYDLLTGSDDLNFITYYWGLLGSVLALVLVDTGGYTFPHVMFFSFFVGHGAMAISVFYIIVIKGYRPDRNELKKAIVCSAAYIFFANEINQIVGGNYNYLEKNPAALPLPKGFVGTIYYKVSILGCLILSTIIEHIPFSNTKIFKNKLFKEKESY